MHATQALEGNRPAGRLFAPRVFGIADLVPSKDLEPAPDGPRGMWRSAGADPQFLIPYSFLPGWVRVRVRLTASTPGRLELHAGTGDDVGVETCLTRAEVQGGVDLDCFVYINHPVRALRLGLPGGVGEFRMDLLRIEALTPAGALGHAIAAKLKLLRKYWRTGPALWRGLGLLARGDFALLREKLFRGLNGPDLDAREAYDETKAYEAWRRSRLLTDADRDRLRAEAAALADPPIFSILMTVADAREAEWRRSVESVLRQTYPAWELGVTCGEPRGRTILAEFARRDGRIRVAEARGPGASLAAASGDYVTLLDEGDQLAEHALSGLAKVIVGDRGLDMLYADEDRITPDGRHVEPYFKPGWSPESLLAWMYTGRPGVYRTELVRRLGGFRAEFDAALEYDLALRVAAVSARVGHVPDVLYHRRAGGDASPWAGEAARRTLRNHLEETGRAGDVELGPRLGMHHVRFALRGAPAVSIIIPSACRPVRVRDESTFYLLKCLESIEKSTWSGLEIIVLHGPEVPPLLARKLDQWGVIRAGYAAPFNWARAMNQGAALARGEHLLFLNDDVEVINPDWLERMLEFSQQPAVGAVGAKLLFPGGRLQHAGVAVLGGKPVHPFYSHPGDHPGYFHGLLAPRNCSAVTGACLMTRADVFRAAGGFDKAFPLNYNDVDYCLRQLTGGRRVVWTPHARLYHHELGTRRPEVRPEERDAFLRRWGALTDDPYYNPNLSTEHLGCRIRTAEEDKG